MTISKETIKAYALENAIKYKGKANQGAVLAGLFAEGLEKSEIKDIMPDIQKVLQEVNKLSPEKQREQFSKLDSKTSKREIREGLKGLPNAEKGKVIMRMAPFPSGPLHIGNARTMVLNDEYVKMYKGKLLIVMDDTIGSEAKQIEPESYKLIEDGIKWLDINYEKNIIYKSGRTAKYYDYAEEMLKKGYLYVCNCSQETMHELKVKGVECLCRQLHPDEQMRRWRKMFRAKMGSMTVRLKTNMQDSDPAFRDRVMFKISDRSHPKTKKKFRVYPSMEFSWAIDDYIFGVTHVLRGTDHYMSTRIQNFIREIFNWKNPESIYNGQFSVEGVKISKSKGAMEVKSGIYIGWNDPRTWSLQSLERRGFEPEAIKKFILTFSVTDHEAHVPVDKLYSENRKLIDEKAERYFFVTNPVEIVLDKVPTKIAKAPLFPGKRKYRSIPVGKKIKIEKIDFVANRGREARLMYLVNVKLEKKSKVTSKKNKDIPKMHWVSNKAVKIKVTMDNGKVIEGYAEPDIKKVKVGQMVQFERLFFARCDKKLEFYYTHR
ncbi:MAG: glutamate--tRNA ligase, partial [Gammaproteobacteria bacterium]|nr:glutamate--tRNA ligase [Gammaproteobacteria bacterium]